MAIPVILVYFVVRRRQSLPFLHLFLLFALFILSCGGTHFMDVYVTQNPTYRLSGLVKAVTAAVSWLAVFALVPVTPKVLALRSPAELEREIAERKRAEVALHTANEKLEARVAERTAELQQAAERLREADKRKDEFLAMLAHELRNPLAPVRTAAHMLRLTDDPGRHAQARAIIERQVGQMGRLIDDLLDVGRITRGKVELRRAPLDLRDAVTLGVETAQPLLDARGHVFTVRLDPEPLPVVGDLARLAQVVANLLGNAAKFTPEGGRITLAAERRGGRAVVCVTDTGIGIPADVLPSVFELFTQADRSLDRAQSGLGIGLSVVKSLVEMHGGTVAVESLGVGRGATFTVEVPLAASAVSAEVAVPVTVVRRAAAGPILVVDDNVDAATTLAEFLELSGRPVVAVHDGPAALAKAAEVRPTAFVLDIGLPDMDGYELARRLRADAAFAGALLVAVTGYGHEGDRQRSKAAGFDHHLVKPVDPEALLALLCPADSSRGVHP